MSAAHVEPMLATLTDHLPLPGSCSGGWRYEPKWDGFRALAEVDEYQGVSLTSRRSKPLTAAFPEITRAVYDVLPARTILDGEIVRWAAGRLDFAALQRRHRGGRAARDLADAEPCHYIAFDLLRLQGRDLTGESLATRRVELEQLLADVPGSSPVTLGLHTDDVELAQQWMAGLAAVGVEGLVVKAAGGRYSPGARGWQKVKHYATTEVLVGGVTGTLDRPGDLILGRYSSVDDQLHVVARSTTLSPAAARGLAGLLTPAGDDHPWPLELPPSFIAAQGRSVGRRLSPSPLGKSVKIGVDFCGAVG